MEMKISEFLLDASMWCQGNLAVNSNGDETRSTAPDAVRWCLIGAVEVCRYTVEEHYDLIRKAEKKLGIDNVIAWQDTPGRAFRDISKLLHNIGH